MATARKIFAAFFLLIFTLYYVNITCFPHGHHIGRFVIVHSHLYSGMAASQPAHEHSTEVLTIISQLSLFLTVAAFFFTFWSFLNASRPIPYPKTFVVRRTNPAYPFSPGRAPPVSR